MERNFLSIRSPNSENVKREADPRWKPAVKFQPHFPRPRPNAIIISLLDHPMAEEIMAYTAKEFEKWDVNIALLGQHKYMVNDCLGLKVSAGEFAMKFGNSSFGPGPLGNGIELKFAIDRISLNGLTLRMRPNLTGGKPCHFSGRFQVGGEASNIQISIRYDPRIDLDECRIASLGDVAVSVSIGGLNLKPLQNNLDKVAKNMIEEAITYGLEALTPDKLTGVMGYFPQGLCPSKLYIYHRYMDYLGDGIAMYSLSNDIINNLQRYYPNVDLKTVRFGYSNRQTSNNATTDCNRIYFNDQSFVDHLKNGQIDSQHWLYHELRHVEQCNELGGRDAYAERWFRDMEYSFLLNLLRGEFGNPIPDIHRLMPMEEDADARADQICNELTGNSSCNE